MLNKKDYKKWLSSDFNSIERLEDAIEYSKECIKLAESNPIEGYEDMLLLHNCTRLMFIEMLEDMNKKERN